MQILEHLKKLEAEASPGPWFKWKSSGNQEKGYFAVRAPSGDENRVVLWTNKELPEFENASLIVAMRNTLPLLIELAEAVDAAMEKPGLGETQFRVIKAYLKLKELKPSL